MKENVITCSNCGAVLTSETMIEFDGKTLCIECLECLTSTCENCGVRMWNDDVNGDSHIILCDRCYDYSYTMV